MQINIELEPLIIPKELSLEDIAVRLLLNQYSYQGIYEISEVFGKQNQQNALQIITQMCDLGIIGLQKRSYGNELVLDITSANLPTTQSANVDVRILKTFKIDENKYLTVQKQYNSVAQFEYNLVHLSKTNYTFPSDSNIQIESKEDMINYLTVVTPIDLMYINGISITDYHFKELLEIFKNYQTNLPLINLCLDYSISTSMYNNLNFKYVNQILATWSKKQILTLEQGFEFLEEVKRVKENKGNKFNEPEYKKPEAVFAEVNIFDDVLEDNEEK